jgi:hypothetical protein
MSFITEKLTEEERNWGIDQYKFLESIIIKGYNNYSLSALKSDYNGWKAFSLIVCNKFVYVLLIVFVIVPVSMFLAFIPLIFALIYLSYIEKKYKKYKSALDLIKTGKLEAYKNSPAESDVSSIEKIKNTAADDVDAIAKLYELLKMGAITQEEFDEKKKKIL